MAKSLNRFLASISLVLILVSSLFSYELPKVDLDETTKTEILVFDAQSIVKDGEALYKIRWETVNATDVMLTFFGKVKVSGEVTVTKDEYNRGPIMLTASNKDGSSVANKTINNKINSAEPIVIFKEKENDTQEYYNTMPYRNYGRRYPIRRRHY